MSSPKPLTPFRKAWLNWKALHLPWRNRFLIGLDLQGNTFWEFRDTLSSTQHRMRRIVHYPRETHYSDIRISPAWHQWLKHVREDAPTIQEQHMDLVRQRNLKVLAAQADARWAAKGSLLDGPGMMSGRVERGGDVLDGVTKAENKIPEKNDNNQEKGDPWKQARGGPSEEWQPKAWDANIPASQR
ncbi:hypothetical protein BJ878DRAFT_326387 [Calycina marina]|uniref:NADH dehydrogenase [ubiquinone] 1 alpha subcomplex subunit n=1 Tax=Calycina marina TaxID=1763456 RepID=A0A9P8CKK4_9HELO|nr:hypothetical protein BJ878DRAFT_326387 [Calycina marina]